MDERWVGAVAALVAGVVVGVLLGALVRRMLGREGRQPPVRSVARAASQFVFWLSVTIGAVVAVAAASPDTLRDVPRDLLDWSPRVAVAGLIVLVGWVVAITASAALAQAVAAASGRRPRGLERAIHGSIIVLAVVVAVAQIGVDTTILAVFFAAGAFGLAASIAGLSVVGGAPTARSLAAGRTVGTELIVGGTFAQGDVSGRIERMTTTHLVVEDGDIRHHIPLSRLADQAFSVTAPRD